MSNVRDNEINDIKSDTQHFGKKKLKEMEKKKISSLLQIFDQGKVRKGVRECKNKENKSPNVNKKYWRKKKVILSSWRKKKDMRQKIKKQNKATDIKVKKDPIALNRQSLSSETRSIHDTYLPVLSSTRGNNPENTWTKLLSSSIQSLDHMSDGNNSTTKSKVQHSHIEEFGEYSNKIYHPSTLQVISYSLDTENMKSSNNQIKMITNNHQIMKEAMKDDHSATKTQYIDAIQEVKIFCEKSSRKDYNKENQKSATPKILKPQEVSNILSFKSILDEDSSSASSSLVSLKNNFEDEDGSSRIDKSRALEKQNDETNKALTLPPQKNTVYPGILFASIRHPPPPPPRNPSDQGKKNISVKKKYQTFKHRYMWSPDMKPNRYCEAAPMTSISFIKKENSTTNPSTFVDSLEPSRLLYEKNDTNIDHSRDDISLLSCNVDENGKESSLSTPLTILHTYENAELNSFEKKANNNLKLKLQSMEKNIDKRVGPIEGCCGCNDNYDSDFSDTQSDFDSIENCTNSFSQDKERSFYSDSSFDTCTIHSNSCRSSYSSEDSNRTRDEKKCHLSEHRHFSHNQFSLENVEQMGRKKLTSQLKTATNFMSQFKSRINDCFSAYETHSPPSGKNGKQLYSSPLAMVCKNQFKCGEKTRNDESFPVKYVTHDNTQREDVLEVYDEIC